ncbi:MAG: prephenate dehydrogenase/arogenate dehydrogenase family protein [Elusimicrobiota bacterium]|jgi:prephenate dehydrogenase|nr:prephenate dehydrogenase/arogenate dehydrogenase family protein [Elusimicrobiota bacterium]
MKTVCVFGLGQIGGSLCLALKKNCNSIYKVAGVTIHKKTFKEALMLNIANEVFFGLQSVKKADIAIICTPVNTIAGIYKQISALFPTAVISDTGSIKHPIEKEISSFLKSNSADFVGAHPMAGKEKSGLTFADADMFKNANVVITGSMKKSFTNENLISDMWKNIGAKIIKMSAKKHDKIASFTSHLPHVISFSLNSIYKSIRRKEPYIDELIAGSFKSATRVASSSADMWAPILSMNRQNLAKDIEIFIKKLQNFKKNLHFCEKTKKTILKSQK